MKNYTFDQMATSEIPGLLFVEHCAVEQTLCHPAGELFAICFMLGDRPYYLRRAIPVQLIERLKKENADYTSLVEKELIAQAKRMIVSYPRG